MEVKDENIQKHINDTMINILIGWLFEVSMQLKPRSLDSIINIINLCKYLLNDDIEIKRTELQCFGCIIFYLKSSQCLYQYHTRINDFNYISGGAVTNFIPNAVELLKREYMYSFTPVEIHISYLILHLQLSNFDEIIDLEKYIIYILLKWAIFNKENQFTIWELISNITYLYCENNNIDCNKIINNVDKKNEELYDKLKNISQKTDNYLGDIIEKYIDNMYI